MVPYKTPLAVQSAIVLSNDLEENEINNVLDFSGSTKMQFMHLVVLPLQNNTVILAFITKEINYIEIYDIKLIVSHMIKLFSILTI